MPSGFTLRDFLGHVVFSLIQCVSFLLYCLLRHTCDEALQKLSLKVVFLLYLDILTDATTNTGLPRSYKRNIIL